MGISGSQKALMAARAGVARSGATRSNYLTHYDAGLVIEIDGVLTDLTKYVLHGSLNVSQNLNDQVDTASFTLIPQTPVIPKMRSRVRIGSGGRTPGVIEFAGQIMTIKAEQFSGEDRRPFIHCTCVDDLDVFDAHFVTDVWPTQSVTTTIRDLVARYTRGGFDTSFVTENLPSVDGFSVANERPSTVLRRITSLIGGGFLIEERRVYAWAAAGHGQALGTPPLTLVDGLHSLKSFARTLDGSQQRTVAFVEGARTEALAGIPALPYTPNTYQYVIYMPVEDASAFVVPLGSGFWSMARIGSQIVTYQEAIDVVPAGAAPLTTLTTAAVAAGATEVPVQTVPAGWPQYGWARFGNQLAAYHMIFPDRMGIDALLPNYGPLRGPVALNESVEALDVLKYVHGCSRDTTSSGGEFLQAEGPFFGWIWSATRAQPQGTPVVLLRAALDKPAADAIAARELSDGYHEHFVQDGRYSKETCLSRAQAEIANFKEPLVTYEWETEDLNAKAGRVQQINLTEKSTRIVDTVRITNVEITWLGAGILPRRQCRATRVEPVSVVDSWLNETS